MIAVYKFINGQKCYLYDVHGNIQIFPNVIAARVSLAMNGFTEDRITGEGFVFERWDEPTEHEMTETEKKLQEQIDKLSEKVKELESIIGAMRTAKIIDRLCELGTDPQLLSYDEIVKKLQ